MVFNNYFKNKTKSRMSAVFISIILVAFVIIITLQFFMFRPGSTIEGWNSPDSNTIEQTDWSGGATGERVYEIPDNSFATSANIDGSASEGSLKLKGF